MSEWTKEPPTKPGWYWWRQNETYLQEPVFMTTQGWYWRGERRGHDLSGEWWPEPIQNPQ